MEMSIKETFDVVFTDINREDKSSELTNILSKNCTKQDVVGNFYKTSILNYRGYVTGEKKIKENLYTERIARSILDNDLLTAWNSLVPVRTNHFVPDHSKKCECIISTNRKEPSVSDETLLRCILEAYTYYKLLALNQVKQKLNDENHQATLNDTQAELVILFDEGTFSEDENGYERNLMVSLDDSKTRYPDKTIKTQQYKEIKGLGLLNENTQLYKLCKAILKQEEMLKQIRFLMLKRSGTQTANRLRDKDDNDSVEYYEYCTECLKIIKD